MTVGEAVQSEAAAAVKLGAGLLTHWQALAFASLALISGLSAGALYFYEKGDKAASLRYERELAQAKGERDAAVAQIAAAAAQQNPIIEQRLGSLASDVAALRAAAKKPPVVFKPDCVMPKSEVDAYNAIH